MSPTNFLFIESLSLETREIDYKNENNQPRSVVLIKLPNLVNNIPPTYIPRIIEPQNDYETIEDHIILFKRIQISMWKKFVQPFPEAIEHMGHLKEVLEYCWNHQDKGGHHR